MDAYQIYGEKKGVLPGLVESTKMRMGKVMEPIILAEYARRFDVRCEMNTERLRGAGELSWMTGTPDGYAHPGVDADSYGLEFKNVEFMDKEDWGPEGSSQIPRYYETQLCWYAMLTGIRRWDLVVLYRGCHLKVYHFDYDAQPLLRQKLYQAGRRFWEEYILTDTWPDESWPAKRPRKKLYVPEDLGPLRSPSSTDGMLYDQWRSAKAKAQEGRAADKEAKAREQEMLERLGGAGGLVGLVRCRLGTSRSSTKWKQVAMDLEAHINDPNVTAPIREGHTSGGDPTISLQEWNA